MPIIFGHADDFDGAPEWATMKVVSVAGVVGFAEGDHGQWKGDLRVFIPEQMKEIPFYPEHWKNVVAIRTPDREPKADAQISAKLISSKVTSERKGK